MSVTDAVATGAKPQPAPRSHTDDEMIRIEGGTFRTIADAIAPAARHAQPTDTSTTQVGFRCVKRSQ
jgi:formylglycine-generating enzyme required for sulfatase activity